MHKPHKSNSIEFQVGRKKNHTRICIADGVAEYFISVQRINVRKPVRKSTPVNLKLENFLFQDLYF